MGWKTVKRGSVTASGGRGTGDFQLGLIVEEIIPGARRLRLEANRPRSGKTWFNFQVDLVHLREFLEDVMEGKE